LILENDLRLSLDRFFDSQLIRAEIAINEALPEANVLDLLAEIAERGVFGAAFQTVRDKIDDLPAAAFLELEKKVPDASDDLLSFFHDRLKVFLRDEGIRHDVIDACIAMDGNDDLNLLVKRARALNAVIATEDGENLVQGFKRANNILTQAEEKDGVEYSYGADVKFAETESEKALFSALDAAQAQIDPALKAEDFPTAMTAMAALRGPVDAFFEDVQVNTDNDILRRNRLNLLSQIRSVCSSVADLTKIEG
jgi:glycyl-tRNA synthetase beta chain